MKTFLLFLIAGMTCTLIRAQTAGRIVVGSSGTTVTDGNFMYSFTVGEAIIPVASSNTVILTQGFQQPEPQASLPVEWLSFRAEWVGEDAQLDWVTNIELQSDYFSVERSIDGQSYERIGDMAAAGYSDTPTGYSFLDKQAAYLGVNTLYYRLRQFDMDGASSLSPVVELRLLSELKVSSELFPNPANTQAFLRYHGMEEESASFLLTNSAGQLLQKVSLGQGSGVHPLATQDLAEGLYYVTFISGLHRRSHKLLIQH